MHARTALPVALLALAGLTGCSSDDKATPTAGTTPATSAASTPTPSPKPSPDKAMTVGDTFSSTREDQGLTFKSTSTVIGYQHDVKASTSADEENGTDGYVWSALEIKVCAKSDGISVSRLPWILAYADGARIEPSGTTYDDFPKPEYPVEAQVKNGDCVRGKITYAVPGDQKPVKVIYAPDGLPEPVEWAMAKS
ncbi:hypothetical protein ACFY3G_17795 [Streptomyces phaeochromogenes]|uniref:hypothetical protein n=1 Tax=Streptomyces phaeochromogenes TaxID=1923 RepID=UPI0036AF0E59